jgi:SAM-dependent methyltransferase
MTTATLAARPFATGVLARIAAAGYVAAYDAVVDGFPPFEALAQGIGDRLLRALPQGARVLDVACGTGTLARRLAARGLRLTGVDAVASLADAATRRTPPSLAARLTFAAADIARAPAPGAAFDALVSVHTLTWHPDRRALLAGCRASLRPGAPAVFVASTRPAAIVPTVRRLAAREGLGAAVRALRWLLPTAAFEAFRRAELSHASPAEITRALDAAGFDVLECVPAFIADMSLLVWARCRPMPLQSKGDRT